MAVCAVVLFRKVGTREHGLPPGPPTLPIIGNLHQFPTESPQYKFTEWARKYGGLYSLKVGPDTLIVLTDVTAVRELLDRRSAVTADRPPLHVADRATGGLHMAFARSTKTWKTLRKASAAVLTPQADAGRLHIQRAEATEPLLNLIHSPHSFYTDIQRYSISVILSILFGKRAPRYDAPEITAFFHVLHEWRWAKWKRNCERVRNLQRKFYFGLLRETKERILREEKNGSYMEEVLERQDELGMDDELTGYFGGALLETGSETTSSYLQSLVLALVAHPDAQRKAQEEMDRVVGDHRMPTLDDLDHMPYIHALILETHRFRPVAPLGVPHATLAAEEYQGYTIPKGAIILVNILLYDNAEDFVPERYLLSEHGTKEGVDGCGLRPTFPFGFGRRVCPGIHLAQNSININVMNLVWAFNVSPDIDADGNPVPVDILAYKKGLASTPYPFKCRIAPRTAEKVKIIEREFLEATDTFSKFEVELSLEDKEVLKKSRGSSR
ncbi:cytochrome P450 [Mycena capillaripes]|nr:cytochrome P450 [Mycena capillaripes]